MTAEIRLSCRDNTFASLSLPTALRVIADLGIPGVDLSVSDRFHQLDARTVLDDSEGQAAVVRRHVREAGLEIADVFVVAGFGPNTIGITDPDADARATARVQFRRYLAFAAALGTPGMTVLPGVPMGADSYAVAVAELGWRVGQAKDVGLRLSVEPYQSSVVKTPEEVRQLVTDVPGLELTLDHSHFVAAGYADGAADVLLPHARHVQARQAEPGHIQTTAAAGKIDFTRVASRLAELGYRGWIGLEYLWAPWIDREVDTIGQTKLLRDRIVQALGRPAPPGEVARG